MDRQDRQDFCICRERLLTASTVLIRYKNPVYPVYPCKLKLPRRHRPRRLVGGDGFGVPETGKVQGPGAVAVGFLHFH